MYVQRNIVALSRNHCCRWKSTTISPSIFELHVAGKNITPRNATTETQQWFPFVLLSSYKILRTTFQQYIST